MSPFFNDFLKEKRFLNNLAENTLQSYRYAYKKFQGFGLEKSELNRFVVSLRSEGLSVGACNVHIRSINSYLSWCFENGHTSEHLKIKLIKEHKRVVRTFSEPEVKAIITYKPKDKHELRLHTILLVLLDTGMRINECLTLERTKVDFENLLLSVVGKGNKERVIPFSIELRKPLYKFLQSHKFGLVFCTRHGGKLLYRNMRRDFNTLMDKLGIKTDGAFHGFRRYYATSFIRQNGNPLILQRLLGHSSLSMTTFHQLNTCAMPKIRKNRIVNYPLALRK